jgi:hypothetical protein
MDFCRASMERFKTTTFWISEAPILQNCATFLTSKSSFAAASGDT